MIIGITGTNGAGKNTIAEYLVQKKGFVHFGTRDILIPEIQSRNLKINRDNMRFVANDLREKHGPDYLTKKLYELTKTQKEDSVIESFRTLGEIKTLKSNSDTYLRGIDADQKTRYQRVQERKNQDSDTISFQEFCTQEEKEYNNSDPTKANLKRCFELSDTKFSNNGKKEELYNQIEIAFQKFQN